MDTCKTLVSCFQKYGWKDLTVNLVGTDDQVFDGHAIVEDEDWRPLRLVIAGDAAVKLCHAEISVCRDASVGSTLDSADSGRDIDKLGRSQGSGESGKRKGSELHGGRRLDCLEPGGMNQCGVSERSGCNDGLET
jgi:hypothetical protein